MLIKTLVFFLINKKEYINKRVHGLSQFVYKVLYKKYTYKRTRKFTIHKITTFVQNSRWNEQLTIT